jgi:hypothetical protein
MEHSFLYDQQTLQEWRSSPCMIPILLDLVKEKFFEINQNNNQQLIKLEINAYQKIYQTWQKSQDLNPKQKEWVEEIGDYINAIKETLISTETPIPLMKN